MKCSMCTINPQPLAGKDTHSIIIHVYCVITKDSSIISYTHTVFNIHTDMGSLLQKHLDHFKVAIVSSFMKRCPSILWENHLEDNKDTQQRLPFNMLRDMHIPYFIKIRHKIKFIMVKLCPGKFRGKYSAFKLCTYYNTLICMITFTENLTPLFHNL